MFSFIGMYDDMSIKMGFLQTDCYKRLKILFIKVLYDWAFLDDEIIKVKKV